jgi:hypothetical protein
LNYYSAYSGRDSIKNPVISQLRATNNSTFSDRGGRKQSTTNISHVPYNFRTNLVYKNKEAFAIFMKIIGEIQLRTRSSIVLQPYLDLFVQDNHFEKLCNQFTKCIFEDLMAVVGYSKNALQESGLLEDESDNFKTDFCSRDIHLMTVGDQKLVQFAKHVI